MTGDSLYLLTLNTGSSSLKAAVYRVDETVQLEVKGTAERIGAPDSELSMTDAAGHKHIDRRGDLHSHGDALRACLDSLDDLGWSARLTGVGHRVVHGGTKYREPTLVTDRLIADLRSLIPIDPDHLPQALNAIEAVSHRFPNLPQVACFDTAFHRTMPRTAQIYALPYRLQEEGVIRFGFHGLSYESILDQLTTLDAVQSRMIVAHLGNGASMAAVRDGRSIDTTMGFTPTGGLVMGTRSGDLDPGVLVYLLQSGGMSPADLSSLVNKQAGLLGVSGSSSDMQDLLRREADDPRAAEAVELFCYQARKYLGALAAVLGGLDTLVFTGGIGEHAGPVRRRICERLDYLGIRLDDTRNNDSAPIISPDNSPVTVRVVATNEDLIIARHTARLVREGAERVSL